MEGSMEKFVSSGSSAARSMYGILNRAEAWHATFPRNEQGRKLLVETLAEGLNAFFWHLSNVAVPDSEELKDVGIESIHQIIAQNPAVLYVAMERLCDVCDENAAEEVFASFAEEWRAITGEEGLGKGYSKSRAAKKLQKVRSLFDFDEETAN